MIILDTIPSIDFLPGSGNWDFIQLLNDTEPADLDTVDRLVLILDNCLEIDSSTEGGVFSWGGRYGDIGVVGLRLGLYKNWPDEQRVIYQAKLVVYDPVAPRGIMWGSIRIRILSSCTN